MAPTRQTTAWLWAGAVVLIISAYWPGLDLPGRGAREALLPPVAFLLLAAGLASSAARVPLRLLALFGVAIVGGSLGVVLAPAAEQAAVLRAWLLLTAALAACLGAAMAGETGRDDPVDTAIERAAVISLIGIAGIGLLQAWTGWQGIQQAGPPASTFVNRNVAAQIVAVLVPLVIVHGLRPRAAHWRWPALLAISTGLAFLVATRARGAWLGLACGMAIGAWILLRARPHLRLAPHSIKVAAALSIAAGASLIPVQTTSGAMPTVGATLATLSQPATGSGGVRLALWNNTVPMSLARPLVGHGAGRFPVVYPLYQAARRPTPEFGTTYQPSHSHNDILEYASELGWPAALALFGALLLGLGYSIRRSPESSYASGDASKLTEATLGRAARAGVIGTALAHGLLSFPLHAPATALVVWIVVGRAWSAVPRSKPSPVVVRNGLIGIALIAALASLVTGGKDVSSRAGLGRAVRAKAAGDCSGALQAATPLVGNERLRDVRGFAAMIVFECETDQVVALDALEGALAMHPNNLNLLLAVGSRRMSADRLDAARQAYQAAVDIVPDQARPWTGLAMSQALGGDREAAAQSCATALRLEPDFAAGQAFCEANGLVP